MYELAIYFNYDERQAQTFRAKSKPALVDKLHKQVKQDGTHNWDGATLGRPLEGHPHVTLSFSESSPSNYAWELDDRRSAYWHLRQRPDEYVEVGPFEEMFHQFIALALEFVEHCNQWPTSVWED